MSRPQSPTVKPITVADFKEIARRRLEKPVWDYYNAGADDENTINRNEEIYKKVLLRPQVLRNVSNVDTATTIFGKRYEIPIAVAPTAYQKLVSDNGEIDVARACHALGTNFILSTNATTTMEDVIDALPPRNSNYPSPWFQLYFLGDRNLTAALIRRAEAAGYEALVLTVDTAVLGNRLPMRKNPFKLPPGLRMENVKSRSAGGVNKARLLLEARTAAEAKKVAQEHSSTLVDASLRWDKVIPWLRSQTEMKIIVKGIMTAEDAARAVEARVDAIVVSNHGGRQLDGVPSTLEMLPEVADAVKGVIPILFDGGISKGSDVFKALALGADLCLIGRSALWGLAYRGQNGLESVFHILERELSRTMALMGVDSVAAISRSMLGRAKENGFGVSKL